MAIDNEGKLITNLADEIQNIVVLEKKMKNRLINWKFKSAMIHAKVFEDDGEALEVLEALSRMFENTGWFDGDMATLVAVAVDMLLGRF